MVKHLRPQAPALGAEHALKSLGLFGRNCLSQGAPRAGALYAQQGVPPPGPLRDYCVRGCPARRRKPGGAQGACSPVPAVAEARGAAVRRVSMVSICFPGKVDPLLFTRLVSLVAAACCKLTHLQVGLSKEGPDADRADWADVQQVVLAAQACPLEHLALSFRFRTGAFPAPLGLVAGACLGTLRVLSLYLSSVEGIAVAFRLEELTALTALEELKLDLGGRPWADGVGQCTLPHSFSRLGCLRSLTFTCVATELAFEPGWGMSSLERLSFIGSCDGFLVPGLDACTRQTELSFCCWGPRSMVSMPANPPLLPLLRVYKHKWAPHADMVVEDLDEPHHLGPLAMCISRMRGLETLFEFEGLETLKLKYPAFTSFPDCLSTLRGLQTLHLGFRCTPVITLPVVVTSLSRLRSLTLGFWQREQRRVEGTLNAAALGDLSAFPRLEQLRFRSCAVECSDRLAHAGGHTTLSCLGFRNAYPCAGHHMWAVLAVHRDLLHRGRQGVSAVHGPQPPVEFLDQQLQLLEDAGFSGEERHAWRRLVVKHQDFKELLACTFLVELLWRLTGN